MIELPAPTHPADVGVHATLLTLADGHFGSRGCIEHGAADAACAVVASGVYTDVDDRRTLLSAPVWAALDDVGTSAAGHRLDLRTGVVEGASNDGFRSLRFASRARPGVMAARAQGPGGDTARDGAARDTPPPHTEGPPHAGLPTPPPPGTTCTEVAAPPFGDRHAPGSRLHRAYR